MLSVDDEGVNGVVVGVLVLNSDAERSWPSFLLQTQHS